MTSIRLAPMAGITDWPFRVLCFEQGCDVATTEMVSAMGYLYAPRNHPATVSLIERRDSEGKLLVQIFGKEADLMARAAEELSAMGRFDGVDVNMGCPAHKVAASGEGSGLMRTPENAEKILRAVCKASHLPVSVKMRLGWDDEHITSWTWRKWRRTAACARLPCTVGRGCSSTAATRTGRMCAR